MLFYAYCNFHDLGQILHSSSPSSPFHLEKILSSMNASMRGNTSITAADMPRDQQCHIGLNLIDFSEISLPGNW